MYDRKVILTNILHNDLWKTEMFFQFCQCEPDVQLVRIEIEWKIQTFSSSFLTRIRTRDT